MRPAPAAPAARRSHKDHAAQPRAATADDAAMRPLSSVPLGIDACARMAQAVDLIPTAALELDARGTILAANDRAVAVFRTVDLVGASVDHYVPVGEMIGY